MSKESDEECSFISDACEFFYEYIVNARASFKRFFDGYIVNTTLTQFSTHMFSLYDRIRMQRSRVMKELYENQKGIQYSMLNYNYTHT